MSYTYKNNTDNALELPNIGVVPAHAEFTSSRVIENPNIEVISEKQVTEQTEVEETN